MVAVDVDYTTGRESQLHGFLQVESGDPVPCCYATWCDSAADTPELGFVDSGESCCCNSDGVYADVGCTVVAVGYAAVDIHGVDPDSDATEVSAAAAVEGEGHRFHFHERDFELGIASLELVRKNPTISSRLYSYRDLSHFVAQGRVRKN